MWIRGCVARAEPTTRQAGLLGRRRHRRRLVLVLLRRAVTGALGRRRLSLVPRRHRLLLQLRQGLVRLGSERVSPERVLVTVWLGLGLGSGCVQIQVQVQVQVQVQG